MTVGAQEDPVRHLQDLLNQVRLNEGLAPLRHSTLLTQAAQRHADDLVTLGHLTHGGSDGSTYHQRIREARYQAWDDGLTVNEAIWMGLGSAEDALIWFYTNPDWAVLTDPKYREVGIGHADDNGVHYFVVTLGARPGVLPVFINDGFGSTDSPVVALRLTNEEAVPFGDVGWIGNAIEIRISNTPDFDSQLWQRWEPLVPWALSSQEPGDYAVYVEFRDGAGRTAIAEATIRLVAPGESPPTPTPFLELPSAPAEQTPGAVQPTVEPTPSSPSTTASPEAEETPPPTALDPAGGTFTPYPTWTPLPTELPLAAEEQRTDWPLLLVILLQGAALLLGAAAFLKRH
ncbi:MAG: CAP domain-containing protein [Anaerolineae bacterium]|nr:CAP domain-containing protein [Anaerolineae bacterium]